LEQGIKHVAQSDKQLNLLWEDLDMNRSNSVTLVEAQAYLKTRYPSLGAAAPLQLAFCNSITVDAKGKKIKKTPGHEIVDPSLHSHLESGMSLPQNALRRFLMRIFHYSKIFCAFQRMDTVRDFEIDIHEFKHGYAQLKQDLQMEIEVDDMFATADDAFNAMRGPRGDITYASLCGWYESSIGEVDLNDLDWFPPESVVERKPFLSFEISDMVDLVLHCHYVTRA